MCLVAGIGLSILGVYAINVGSSVDPPESLSAITGVTLRQVIFLGIGLLAAALVTLPHYRVIRLVAWPVLVIVVGLLIFLLIPVVPSWLVTPRNGVRGWINLGPIDLQPAELAKIAYVLAAADYLRYRRNHRTMRGLIPPAIITAVPVGLITLQPDLGSAMLFVPGAFAILLTAGARLKHLAVVVLAGALAAPAAYPFLKPYQQQRILGLLAQFRGERHANDDLNFQSYTATMLIGAGGVDGYNDLKARNVVRYSRLPERHNDMVFAVIVSRFGLWGGLGLMALYGLWVLGAVWTAAACKDAFGRLMVVGFVAIISAQTIINLGMVLGVLPIVGLTLPFVSYGGSSMLSVWIMTGLIVNVAMRKPQRMARPTFEFGD